MDEQDWMDDIEMMLVHVVQFVHVVHTVHDLWQPL